jgi:4-hydroxybenzoate polyprenyltransferase
MERALDRTNIPIGLMRQGSRPVPADRWSRRAAATTIVGLSALLWIGIGVLVAGV